jgi:chromosomal replication initiator protein DnaA
LFGSGRAEAKPAARPAEQTQKAAQSQTKPPPAEPEEKQEVPKEESRSTTAVDGQKEESVPVEQDEETETAKEEDQSSAAVEVEEEETVPLEDEDEEAERTGKETTRPTAAKVESKKEASVRLEVLEEDVEEETEVGVPIDGDKAVAHIARPQRAGEFKDTDDELPVPEYTFENFLVGQVNTFTYAIARAVADAPGTEYNPLFVYGEVGLGKTHLVCAIGNEILATQPEKRVIYTSAGTFSTQLVEAIQRHDVVSFRERYTERDVVMIDDAQFLAGREKTQEEFFDIFNSLHEEHKQIIIASDKPPSALVALEKRLVSRFAGGIVAGLAAPEWETRMAILKHQADKAGCEVPEDVMGLVATRVTDDVRKLLGAMRKVMAFCELVQQDISTELAQEVLDHLFEKKQRGQR